MASYRLLRNNQESGPFEFGDLVKYGLKPYDLVWVQGKSAAWRYPSEVEELKPHAPAVEEQPYDRFFKKPSRQVKEEVDTTAQTIVQVKEETAVTPPQVKEKPVEEKQEIAIEEKYEKYIPKKSVFVTMPGQGSQNAYSSQNGHSGQNGQKAAAAQKPLIVAEPQYKPEPEPAPTPIITVTENPEAAKIKFSQPLDEIKEMYVKTLQQRKTKIARKNFLLTNLKRVAVILGLVALGILAGLAINSDSGDNKLASQSVPQSVPVPAELPNTTGAEIVRDEPQTEENNSTVTNPVTDDIQEHVPLPPRIKQQMEVQEERELTSPSRPKKQQVINNSIDRQQQYEDPQPLERDPVTGERSKKVRSTTDLPEDKPIAKAVMGSRKSGLESMVSIISNDYKRVAFGGIRNLELTVTNDSKFILDKVTVQLQYLKPSEEPLKTELIQFHSISPNGSMTMRVKDTNRGIKVTYKIVDIQSQHTETALRE